MAAPKGNKFGNQFKPGYDPRRNMSGRQRGWRAPTTIIKDYLTDNPDKAEEIVEVAIQRAAEGDFQYFKYLCDRLEGTPAQTHEHKGEITHNIKRVILEEGESAEK